MMSVQLRNAFDLEARAAPRKIPRQERSRVLVEAIVEAGTRILVRQGREAVTTNSVAAVAGVSIGSLYQYFPHREAIIAAVARRHALLVHACVADVDLARAATLEHAIVALVDALFESHFLEPELHLALVHDLEPHIVAGPDGTPLQGAKPAVVGQLIRLSQHFGDCAIGGDVHANTAFLIAELTHALAHAAINPHVQLWPVDDLKREAVRVTMSYCRPGLGPMRANTRIALQNTGCE